MSRALHGECFDAGFIHAMFQKLVLQFERRWLESIAKISLVLFSDLALTTFKTCLEGFDSQTDVGSDWFSFAR